MKYGRVILFFFKRRDIEGNLVKCKILCNFSGNLICIIFFFVYLKCFKNFLKYENE